MKRPDWLTPAHEEAVVFLLATFAGGFAAAVLGALVDRRLRCCGSSTG